MSQANDQSNATHDALSTFARLVRLTVAATGADVAALFVRGPVDRVFRVAAVHGMDPSVVQLSPALAMAMQSEDGNQHRHLDMLDPLAQDAVGSVLLRRIGSSEAPLGWLIAGLRGMEPAPQARSGLADLAGLAEDLLETERRAERQRADAEHTRTVLDCFAGGIMHLEPVGSPAATDLADIDFRITSVNRSAAYILGFAEPDLIGWSLRERFPDADIESIIESHRQAMCRNTAQYAVQEFSHGRAGGSFAVHSVPAPGGVVVSFVDVTEQVATVDRLRRRTEMLRAIGTVADVGGWEYDCHDGTMSWSTEMFRLHDVPMNFAPTLESALGFLRVSDAMEIGGCLERGTSFDEVVCYRTASGERRWGRMQGVRQSRADGTGGSRWIGAFQDVTEQHRQTEANAQLRSRLEAVIESVPVAIALKDANGRYLIANGGARRLFAGEHDPIGQTDFELMVAHDLDGIIDPNDASDIERAVLRDGTIHERMVSESTPAGGRSWAVSRHPYRDEAGRPVGVIVVARDVSLYEQRRREAEEASETKSSFLANMSHEIRSPMTSVLGFTDLLIEESDELSPSDRAGYLRTIRRNGCSLLQLINDILDLSKIEAGEMTIEPATVHLAGLVADVRSLMQVRANEGDVQLSFDVASDSTLPVPAAILTDGLRLRQILINLIGNAIKFSQGGSVHVAVSRSQAGIAFSVRDTGIGMLPEQVADLFQPFRQADASTARRFGGTGLGLSISQRLAHALGGQVAVDSEAGKGSTFTVTVGAGPVDPAAPSIEGFDVVDRGAEWTDAAGATGEAGGNPAAAADISGLRILLADDGPDNRRLICHLLHKAGAQIVAVNNGREAIDAVHAAVDAGEPFDLVLMDVQMPVLDGCDATRELRRGGLAAPIIALTADAMAGARDRALAAGCTDFASKPIRRLELLALCERWGRGVRPEAGAI
ncbi:MAG: ATP-binding protein [Phycisphaerales bacterium]